MVELFINGTDSAVGQITLYGDEPLSLNISIQDVKDISKRNSTFSQTFTIPADRNNNTLLNHIFNIGADSSFDPSQKTPSFILNDGMPVFNGQFQLTKINVKNMNVISYECVVYGEMIDLVKSLGDSLLTDLDYSELDHIYSSENIENSWTSDTRTLGYYYPLIDYGYDLSIEELNSGILSIVVDSGEPTSATSLAITDSTKLWSLNAFVGMTLYIIEGSGFGQSRTIVSNTLTTIGISTAWNTIPDNTSVYQITRLDTTNPYSSTGNGLSPLIFKPALGNTYLIQKILDNVGFIINPGFIDTSDIIGQTIIPFNGNSNNVLPNEYMDEFSFRATMPDAVSNSTTWSNIFTFDDTTTPPNFDNGNLFDYETYPGQPVTEWKYRYVADRHSAQSFVINLRYYFYGYNIVANKYLDVNFYRQAGPTGTPVLFSTHHYDLGIPLLNVDYNLTIESKILDSQTTPGLEPLAPGDIVYATYLWQFGGGNHLIAIRGDDTYMYNKISPQLVPNGKLFYNSMVPPNIKQVDYIKSIITMFNLMVIPNKNDAKRLTLIPRNDYYAAGEIKDWTNKIDHTEKIEETLISEQQSKSIKLSYKEDKDYYNANYKEETNTVYGQYIQYIDNEWVTGEKKIDVIFSPTPVDRVIGSTDIYAPKIAKRDEKSGIYGRTDFNLRFLRKNALPMATQNTIQLEDMPPRNSYPYCGHLDHPINPTIDYNFGAVDFVYYEGLSTMTPHNLVYDYWKQYLDDINDKNSKLIKCKIYLTPDDIAQFNYNDSIYIEGLTSDGGHYFNVNKINYIPTSNLPSTIELIKNTNIPKEELEGKAIRNNLLNPIKYIDLGNENLSKSAGAIVLGDGNNVDIGSKNTFIAGNNNVVGNSSKSYVVGNNVTIGSGVIDAYIFGNNVIVENPIITTTVGTGVTATTVVLSGVTIFGNDYTATTSNTVYVPNMQFTSTGSTINGVPVSAVTTSASLWTSGSTGSYNIRAVNDTIIDATGNYAYAEGAATTAVGIASHAEGSNTVAFGTASHAGGIEAIANNTAEWARAGQGSYGQYGFVDFFGASTTAALGEIFIGGGVNERFSIPTDTAFRYRLNIIARVPATGDVKEWEALGLIKNVGGTTSIVGSSNTSTFADASLATASIGVSADNTNDSLLVERLGVAGTTIKWYGRLEYVKTL